MVELPESGSVVRTLRGVGHRGNWKAQGNVYWRVIRTRMSSIYNSGVCVELKPLDTRRERKTPLCVDLNLVKSVRLRVEDTCG